MMNENILASHGVIGGFNVDYSNPKVDTLINVTVDEPDGADQNKTVVGFSYNDKFNTLIFNGSIYTYANFGYTGSETAMCYGKVMLKFLATNTTINLSLSQVTNTNSVQSNSKQNLFILFDNKNNKIIIYGDVFDESNNQDYDISQGVEIILETYSDTTSWTPRPAADIDGTLKIY